MATLTGALKDFTPQPLGSSANAVLVFTPYGPAGSSTKSLLVSREIRVSPASDGSFSVDLAAYASTNPNTAYKLRVEWFDSGGNYLTTEEIPWAVVVSGDGSLVDMFAEVRGTTLVTKGDKGNDGNVLQQAAIDSLTAKNVTQDSRLDGVEAKNTTQDGRLTTIEAKNTAQDAALADLPNQYTPLSRGTLADGTDLNSLTGNANVGTYSLRTSSTYPNAPAFTSSAVLEVQRGSGNNFSVIQRLTFGTSMLWREAADYTLGTWSAWVQAQTVDRADAANAVQDGRLGVIESKNTEQDGRLTAAEAKNAAQDGRLDVTDGRLTGLEAVAPKVSNIALDADGTPYYKPGSTEVHIIPDGDDVPYFITFLQAAVDTDGALYF